MQEQDCRSLFAGELSEAAQKLQKAFRVIFAVKGNEVREWVENEHVWFAMAEDGKKIAPIFERRTVFEIEFDEGEFFTERPFAMPIRPNREQFFRENDRLGFNDHLPKERISISERTEKFAEERRLPRFPKTCQHCDLSTPEQAIPNPFQVQIFGIDATYHFGE